MFIASLLLVMFATAEQNDFPLHFINVLWSFSFQTGITLGSVSKCYQCGSVGGVTDDNCFDDKVESSYSPTDCGFGLWKYCTVSRYCFDISTPGLKEGENVFSNTLNTPHLDFSYKAILPDLHHLQWSLIRLSNYLHGNFFHNVILLIDISNSA